MRRSIFAITSLGLIAFVGLAVSAREDKKPRYFEMREYIANPGKAEAMHKRFREHTCALFQKHGIELVGFWTPAGGENAENRLIYIVAFPGPETRDAMWKAFAEDPEWVKAKGESEKDGVLVGKVIQTFMNPTDYSPIR